MKIESQDYELIQSSKDENAWSVRFLTGPFNETVISYGSIAISEEDDFMTFNFNIDFSPDPDLTTEVEELQEEASAVLASIITNSLEENSK